MEELQPAAGEEILEPLELVDGEENAAAVRKLVELGQPIGRGFYGRAVR